MSARGDFPQLSYRMERDAAHRLVADAIEQDWGAGYLSFGLGFSSDNQGDSRIDLRGSLGGLLELGRSWDHTRLQNGNPIADEKNRYGRSIFLATDSWFGPLYLAWGLAAEGDNTVYFQIGRS